MTTDDFTPEVQIQEGQQGQGQPVQTSQPAETQASLDGMALSFITEAPASQPASGQPGTSDGESLERVRARMVVLPSDAAVIAYVSEHNRQNPGNPISLADASKEVKFAAREAAPIFQAQPPTDFAARIRETQQAQAATETAIAEASEAGDHQRVAQLTRHMGKLEADIRDIQRDDQAWQQYAQRSQQQAQTTALEQAQGANYADLQRRFPDLANANSELRQRFEREWQMAGDSGASVLRDRDAPESILGRVIAQMGGLPQAQPASRPQAQTWPVIPGTANPTSMRNGAPAFKSEAEIERGMLAGEYSQDQLDAFLNARRQ